MDSWKFELRQIVKIAESGEQGSVVGRAEYADDERRYLLRYRAGNGCAVESWWAESALAAT